MQVVFVTRRDDHQLNNNTLITKVAPEDYDIYKHLLKRGKCKIKSPVSYSDWYVLSHDIETDSWNPLAGNVLLSAFCDEEEEVLVIDNTSVSNIEIFTPELLKQCFFIAHNADFEARWGYVNKFLPGRYGCTMVNSKRLLSGQEGFHFDLVSEINRRLGYKQIPIWMDKDIREQFATVKFFTDEQILYNAADTIRLKQLYFTQLEEAAAINQLFLHFSINSRIIIPIAKAEVTGIKHDTERWINITENRKKEAEAICQELTQQILLIPGIEIGKINPAIKKEQESKEKRLEKQSLRKQKLETQLKQLEEKGKTHLKSYKVQLESYQKILSQESVKETIIPTDVINWGSQKQVMEVLRQVGCPLPVAKDKATHEMKAGVGKEARANWFVNNVDSPHYDLMKKFDKFKKIEHNIKSFGQKWVDNYVRNGRAYTSLDQAGTATGRFSSGSKGKKNKTEANMQQIPARGDGKVYRECFVADDGRLKLTLDFSNCEGCVMTALSKDLNMMKILQIKDSHSYLGTKCWRNIYADRFRRTNDPKWKELAETYQMNNIDPERIKERDTFKNSGGLFPVAYGVASAKVAATSKISTHEGQILIDTIKAEIPQVIQFLDGEAKHAITHGYVIHNKRTGSRRWFTPILDELHYGWKASKSQLAEIQFAARNSDIQATNSDLMKESIAMIDMYINIFKQDIRFLLTVHDEYVGDAPEKEAEFSGKQVQKLMQRAAQNYLIPEVVMGVDLRVAKYWKK